MIKRNFFQSLFGIGIGQGILLLATPFLARVYGPVEYGNFLIIVAAASVVAAVSALRLELALGGASDCAISGLTKASLVAPVLVIPLTMALLVVVFESPFGGRLPFALEDLPLIGGIALLQGFCLVGSALNTRLGAFGTFAKSKIIQPLIFVIFALFILDDLAVAMALGWVASLVVTLPTFRRITFGHGWHDSWAHTRAMWRFPVVSAPLALLDVLAISLPLLVIASVFGEGAAGNYGQVQRLIGGPLLLVAAAVGSIFIKHAGDGIRTGRPILPLLVQCVVLMLILSLAVALLINLAGSWLLQIVMGSGWRTDTSFLMLVLLPVLFRVVASPVSNVLILTYQVSTLAKWQLFYFVATVTTLTASTRGWALEDTLFALVCSDLLMYSIYVYLNIRSALRNDLKIRVRDNKPAE